MKLQHLFRTPVNEPHSAEFGSAGLIGSWFNKGFVVGRYKRLSEAKSFEGLLLSGPTGSGKTSRFLAKSILSLTSGSMLINDPQGELWHLCSGYLTEKMDEVYSINFSDATKSAGFNPFSRIKKANDVNKLASLLITTSLDKGNSDPFWTLASTNLTAVLIRILLYQPKPLHNISNLIRLLHYFAVEPAKVDAWAAQSNDEKLIIDYKSILAIPPKTLDNVYASVKSALQVFDDIDIAKTTAFDTVNFDDLRKKRVAIFLNNALGDQKYISILISIFFDQFYSYALETLPSKDDNSIYVVLEEAASLNIPMLAQATATSRKAKVANYIAVQAHSQLKTFYREQAETIKSNCRTKMWLTGQTSLDELREIETLSGKRIYKDENGVERTVPLISTDNIRMLPENKSLILSGNHPLILARSSAYYKSPIFKRRASYPPAPFTKHIPDDPIPMLT